MEKRGEEKENDPVVQEQVLRATEERQEITMAEIAAYASAANSAVMHAPATYDAERYKQQLEQSMLQGVHGLPERLAARFGTVDPAPYLERASQVRAQIERATEPNAQAKLQEELIFQYLAIISRVQNGGDKGITPAVAEEVGGIDCSLSAWCLKEKLQGVPNMTYRFGAPTGHAVGIVTLANGQTLYVDAQNGFAMNVQMTQVHDADAPNTAYPIFEIEEGKNQRITASLPGEGIVSMTRKDGCDYMPNYVGVREDGLHLTTGNFHMLLHPTSPIFMTAAAQEFRKKLGIPPPSMEVETALKDVCPAAYRRFQSEGKCDDDAERLLLEELRARHSECEKEIDAYARLCHDQWNAFNHRFVEQIEGGRTLYDTKFGTLAQKHHDAWKAAQIRASLQ